MSNQDRAERKPADSVNFAALHRKRHFVRTRISRNQLDLRSKYVRVQTSIDIRVGTHGLSAHDDRLGQYVVPCPDSRRRAGNAQACVTSYASQPTELSAVEGRVG